MGMDVYGQNPKDESGTYFRANVWYWHPLWDCLETLHPIICQKCEFPHDNSGSGLNPRDSKALASLLKRDLEDGTIEKYIEDYNAKIASLPKEDCKYCDQQGTRDWDQLDGTVLTKVCNACNGTLKVEPFQSWYHMDLDLMKEFQVFLQNCGGFQIH